MDVENQFLEHKLDKGVAVSTQKGKENMKNTSTRIDPQAAYVVEKDDFNFRRDIILDYLGLVKESSLSLLKLFKWFFHEMNSTNVWVRAMTNNAKDTSSSKGSNM